jgi:hypothetical protein
MTIRWQEPIAAGSGLLVLASGWLPWWVVRVLVSDDYGTRVATFVGTAWKMSSRWSTAIAIAAAAVAVWLIWRFVRGRVPLPVWLAVLSAVTVSVFLTLVQRSDVEPMTDPEKTEIIATVELDVAPKLEPEPGADIAADWMKRDHLVPYRSPGLNVGLGWGLWAGLAGMVLAGVALAATNPRGTDPGSDPTL